MSMPGDQQGNKSGGGAADRNGKPALLPQHITDLRKSGLSDETIAAAGLYSRRPTQQYEYAGRSTGQQVWWRRGRPERQAGTAAAAHHRPAQERVERRDDRGGRPVQQTTDTTV